MRIDHDKVSGALYIKFREGEYDHTEDFSERADVYLDVDTEGNVLGLEALSFEDLAQAIEEHGGKLDLPERLGSVAGFHASESARDGIELLDTREREALRLRRDGVMGSKVAERLGVSLEEAYRLQFSALTKLREAQERERPGTVDDASIEAFLSRL